MKNLCGVCKINTEEGEWIPSWLGVIYLRWYCNKCSQKRKVAEAL